MLDQGRDLSPSTKRKLNFLTMSTSSNIKHELSSIRLLLDFQGRLVLVFMEGIYLDIIQLHTIQIQFSYNLDTIQIQFRYNLDTIQLDKIQLDKYKQIQFSQIQFRQLHHIIRYILGRYNLGRFNIGRYNFIYNGQLS